jgi:glyoxylase-like metal-dependent hydrolase (beta-lactamase superfamily II)
LDVLFEDVDESRLTAALGPQPAARDAPYNCLLVRAARALVLVDTGLGASDHPFGGSGGRLVNELEAAGVDVRDVDVVFTSHGHLDHIGGLTMDGAPAFPNARYVIPDGEWIYWTSEDALTEVSELSETAARTQLPPLEAAGLVERIAGEVELTEGVRALPAPGHTIAHAAIEVGDSGGLLYAVDALLHPLQVERPEWGQGIDSDPKTAIESRRALVERATERGHLIAASHWDVTVPPPTQGG